MPLKSSFFQNENVFVLTILRYIEHRICRLTIEFVLKARWNQIFMKSHFMNTCLCFCKSIQPSCSWDREDRARGKKTKTFKKNSYTTNKWRQEVLMLLIETILKIIACFSNSYNPYDREGGAYGQKTLKLPRRIHILPINGARTGQEVLLASAVITGDLCRFFALVWLENCCFILTACTLQSTVYCIHR